MTIRTQELVINFHMTEACNFRCAYCYAKWNDEPSNKELYGHTGAVDTLLTSLANYFFASNPIQKQLGYQRVRINFAGGEPMMLGKYFSSALAKAKALGFQTSVITNGHFLRKKMMREIAPNLDMLGISFDTADELIAQSIGRVDRHKRWLSPSQLLELCNSFRSINPLGKLKLNTVINPFNACENLSPLISQIKPDKWKLLRVLPVHDESQVISDTQYQAYINRHLPSFPNLIIEDNDDMWQSYLMINPQGQFYQNVSPTSGHIQSKPILQIGVHQALSQIPFDMRAFAKRYSEKGSS
ncbi:viperin family antiviral radical SAM protein [Pseudidiomarina donghaiensis]|uniref:S-adenosylmethionine-dependent nucleotide dehydratase n=1 Tax=Pseudidiomarina donghaiensis TaxID=519452 RepID=A0A432XBB9_9GAMM|nr:viperin family antiviral radical SAM protein [Pseudidiomarina donghaiensis]RUO45946.1 radical SAM protein [Pseudidiomarina donghaiensis]SFV25089.1 radical S-adenosyl methionine domain-containing protein 2 [Pseudidiomarina donghaiensis]